MSLQKKESQNVISIKLNQTKLSKMMKYVKERTKRKLSDSQFVIRSSNSVRQG